jgi:hypothetical protein
MSPPSSPFPLLSPFYEPHFSLWVHRATCRDCSAGVGRAGIGCALNGRAGIDRAGIGPAGIGCDGIGRAGIDRAGADRAGIGRVRIGRVGIGRAGISMLGSALPKGRREKYKYPGEGPTSDWFASSVEMTT